MVHSRRTFTQGIAAALCLGPLGPVVAQTGSRTVRLVVPFPPGGGADIASRLIAQPLGEALGQPVVVENRAGADGIVAADAVIKSAPDGQTLFFGTATAMSGAPAIRKSLPYDPVADFTPISRMGTFIFFVVVPEEVPARTLPEFIAHARAQPGKLNYGSGTVTAIIGLAQLAQLARLQMVHVPYKGDAPLIADMLAGRVQLGMAAGGPLLPQVRAGKLRALATLSAERSPLLPEVPTLAQEGLPPLTISIWGGLFGPAGMPRETVDRIQRALASVLARAEVRDQLSRNAFEPQSSTPDELRALVRDQLAAWKAAAQAAGIQPE